METFTGPPLVFISYAQFLLPLLLLELYFRADASRSSRFKLFVGGFIFVAALSTLVGVGAASTMMWFT